ncbi:hypothetical protein LPTSP4_25040 [Leptospira ryugenii]|uniref:Uncharacterized protein n=2 Tax=Leptospira ryugenii TaxID=1917863 RepID=A0A2P2E249_9LEPT|nr:hypothetical protein LPTSP4_25040 [Leptospira ryugenii]
MITDSQEIPYTKESLHWFSDTLNQEFHSGEGESLAEFYIIGISTPEEIAKDWPQLSKISSSKEFWSQKKEMMMHPMFRKDAINLFIFSNPEKTQRSQGGLIIKAKNVNGKRFTEYFSWILFEKKAFLKKDDKLLLHEAGHAFSLTHVKPINGIDETSQDRNIMTGSEDTPETLPEGESGYYFTPSQSETIKRVSKKMLEAFQRQNNPLKRIESKDL